MSFNSETQVLNIISKREKDMIENIKEITECPDCASGNIVHNMEREQVVCRECGLIYEPLTPEEENAFERAHDLTMPRPRGTVKSTVKAKKTVKAKAKPKKRRK